MSLSLYIKENKNKNSYISSDISHSNILNYKRRSKLVTYNSSDKSINSLYTLKNCYNVIFDLKNILSDYIDTVKTEKRLFTKTEEYYIDSVIKKSKEEILTVYNIYSKNVKNIKLLSREEKNMIKSIDNLSRILSFLYDDIGNYRIL